ncbi:MAG TPA: hypothetical protein VM491_22805 [Burkholderiaceae bacterium]|nr:hypothetical protein [Burkholderiaceae bacterium]
MIALIAVAWFGVSAASGATDPDRTADSAAQVRKELAEAADAIRHYSFERRDEAVRKAKQALDSLDARIAALNARIEWDKLDQAAREQAQATMRVLEQQRRRLADWYDSAKASAPGAWERIKKGFADGYDALRGAFDDAERDVGTPRREGSGRS